MCLSDVEPHGGEYIVFNRFLVKLGAPFAPCVGFARCEDVAELLFAEGERWWIGERNGGRDA